MRKIKLVAIGNSIVNGFPHKRSLCFASLLREEAGYDVINKGENGQTTMDLLARFDRDVIQRRSDAVLIMSGTNDFIYGESSPARCLANLKRMADMADGAGIQPVLLTPLLTDPAMAGILWMAGAGVDYENINKQLSELAEEIHKYGNEVEIAVADVQSAFSDFAREAGVNAAYHDGVHPTVKGQRAIFDCLREVLPRVLRAEQ